MGSDFRSSGRQHSPHWLRRCCFQRGHRFTRTIQDQCQASCSFQKATISCNTSSTLINREDCMMYNSTEPAPLYLHITVHPATTTLYNAITRYNLALQFRPPYRNIHNCLRCSTCSSLPHTRPHAISIKISSWRSKPPDSLRRLLAVGSTAKLISSRVDSIPVRPVYLQPGR